MNLYDRIRNPERRQTDITPVVERREASEPFMAPWRKRQIDQAGGRFVAVTDTTKAA